MEKGHSVKTLAEGKKIIQERDEQANKRYWEIYDAKRDADQTKRAIDLAKQGK